MGPLQYLNGPQFKWAPNNNFDLGSPGPFDLIFANQFKWAPHNNIEMDRNFNGPPTIILIQGARTPLIYFLLTNSNGPPTIVFKWAPNNNIDPGGPDPSI